MSRRSTAGSPITWTLQVTNDGPSTADGVSVSDLLPTGVTVVSVSGTGWTLHEGAAGLHPIEPRPGRCAADHRS